MEVPFHIRCYICPNIIPNSWHVAVSIVRVKIVYLENRKNEELEVVTIMDEE